jgi:hypothetical protein
MGFSGKNERNAMEQGFRFLSLKLQQAKRKWQKTEHDFTKISFFTTCVALNGT